MPGCARNLCCIRRRGKHSSTRSLPRRCTLQAVELEALLSAAQGVREALAAAESRTRGARHGDPYTLRQLTRINIPGEDPVAAQVGGGC